MQDNPPNVSTSIGQTNRRNRQANCERKYLAAPSKLEIQSDLIPCPNMAKQAGIANEQITLG